MNCDSCLKSVSLRVVAAPKWDEVCEYGTAEHQE